jgi:cytochrome P450
MATLHQLWASVVSEGHHLHEEFLNLRELLDLRLENLLAKPGAVRPLFAFLRQHHPIFVAPHIAVVTRYDDVQEVLGNAAAFSVTEIYLKKMEQTTGDFVLGMADTPQYQREIGLMHAVFKAEDLDTIRAFVNVSATQAVAAAAPEGHIDAVTQLSRLVPTHLLGAYFGTPGPDDATIMRWMRSIFREIFLDLGNDPRMGEAARQDAVELNAYLNALIAQRRAQIAAGETVPDDFLCRLLKLDPPIEDDVVRRIVGGTIVGAVDTNSKAIIQALDQLLLRPQRLLEAHEAALADDDATVAQYVFEALRFNPQNPFLLRHCTQTTTIAEGTPRATEIPAGSMVLAGTESAMFDADRFPEPDAFSANRPLGDYIHFGYGLHTCFGKGIGQILIPGVAKALLKQPNLRRVGDIQYDGAFPDHYPVEFTG